jgi:superfamily II DNA or RNA helicase
MSKVAPSDARRKSGSTVVLRHYQSEALAAVERGLRRGIRRPLIELPTGTGKTIIFAEALRQRAHHGRGLVLAHRDELIEQAVAKIAAVAPDLAVGVVKAERNETDAPVIVASVQTLSRPQRLTRLGRDFATVVVDEAHHATADSYVGILEHMGSFDDDGPLTLGVTATPERADGTPLSEVWQKIVYRDDLLTMIKAGFLCDLRALRVQIKVNLDRVRTRTGDFAVDELDAALRNANAPRHAVLAYMQHASGRKATLVFTTSVTLAHDMASAFRNAGVAAEALDGSTPTDERRAILARLHSGKTRVVANCAVLTEGFDEPSIDCVIVARPTQSRPLYVQMIGRGTRLFPGKPDCLVVDLVGASTRHELVSIPELFGLSPKLLDDGKVTVCEAIQRHAERQPIDGAVVTSHVDLFKRRSLRWVPFPNVTGQIGYALTIPDGQVLLRPSETGWRAEHITRARARTVVVDHLDLGYAQGAAEDYVRRMGAAALNRSDARWRQQPATAAQYDALRKWRVPITRKLTKGAATDLLTAAAARWRAS